MPAKQKKTANRLVLLTTFAVFAGLFSAVQWSEESPLLITQKQIAYGYDPPPPPPASSTTSARAVPRGSPASAYNTSTPTQPTAGGPPSSVPLTCGNGNLDKGEECDYGSRINGLRNCTKECTLYFCGDGVISVQSGEECEVQILDVESYDEDTKTMVQSVEFVTPVCGKYCTPPVCDRTGETDLRKCTGGCRWKFQDKCPFEVTPLTQQMIDKILGRSASSGSQSSPSGPAVKGATVESQQKALQSLFHSACGNGRVDSGESCDQGEQNSDFIPNACRTNCTLPLCGDGVTDSVFGEVCDQGLENSNGKPDTCRFACTPPICGDNVHDSNEECDGTPGCDKQCLLSGIDRKQVPCGNGLLDEHEQCDDGNRKAGDGCSLTCQNETSVCGNHILDLGEECDDGNTRDGDFCSRFCVLVRKTCGNGSVDINEQCDEGKANSDSEPDHCRKDCTRHRCGDSVLDSEEECDDGNDISTDNCTAQCQLPVCGDNFVQAGEQCDDGNDKRHDGCGTL
ncbi:MAG: DUF4215 domain-containing protein, partial [Patescibacteria group bacterium]